MTDPVEALAAALEVKGIRTHEYDGERWVSMEDLRASGFDVVPTGDAELDVERLVPKGWKFHLTYHRDADDPNNRWEASIDKSMHEWTGDEKSKRAWAATWQEAVARLSDTGERR